MLWRRKSAKDESVQTSGGSVDAATSADAAHADGATSADATHADGADEAASREDAGTDGGDVSARRRPSADEIADELHQRQRRRRTWRVVGSTIGGLLTVAAIVVLLATFLFPTLRIYGTSMTPTLREGEVVVSVKTPVYQTGEVIAFYYNNKILVKRVICGPGEWFNMQEDGSVYVNGTKLDEPYVSEEGFGSCDLDLPYQVPEDQYFVMGDQRISSIDSRMSQVGCVPVDRIVGRIILRVWPLDSISAIE
jgi:signal peptidase I